MALFLVGKMEEGIITFDEEVSHHLLRSVRKSPGDTVFATDGKGRIFTAEILTIAKNRVRAKIINIETAERVFRVTIACSLVKKESRFENFLEKSTELGVEAVIPLICERTLKPGMRLDRNLKILSAAAQQAFNPFLPELSVPVKWKEMITSNKFAGYERFIATAVDRHEAMNLEWVCSGEKPVVILIGPEGDFTEEEKEAAMKSGWLPVSLGDTRLRTETAAMMAVQIVKSCYQFKKKKIL